MEWGVGDEIQGHDGKTNRVIRGKIIEVLPDGSFVVQSTCRSKKPYLVPYGDKVTLTSNDIDD